MKKNENEELTVVVFRKWKKNEGGGVIALFPLVPEGPYCCSSYEHIGQHGGADYAGVVSRTVRATPEEYADLKEELERIGYRLKIVQKIPSRRK